jgi:hypothetical protein
MITVPGPISPGNATECLPYPGLRVLIEDQNRPGVTTKSENL